ncbi:hypothetical protein Bhyg_16556 [Pseudolycoriella hygida]|uniref:Uncharacterized protein n=1 Tax=Pseudolycoriella hygida TaxID=35572 RepID=A0A9Q0RVD2_9DIPT|nr:hypothetical protein Bhyg_16556 [Pseudolycoriella hygida]
MMYTFSLLLSFANLLYLSAGSSKWFFDSNFSKPDPPMLVAEYYANFVQHKWDATGISNIASGTIYANLEVGRLRMDLTHDGVVASSLFDYSNANQDGTVPNYMYTLAPTTASNGTCAQYTVVPAYPLFTPDILIQSEATFVGLVNDDLFYVHREPLNAWDVLIAASISATVYVDSNNTLVRMDFSTPMLNTFTTTRLFNIKANRPANNLFDNPCPEVPVDSGARRTT